MTTAIGSYATLAGVRLRLGLQVSDTGNDGLISEISDQVNQYIESKTGRPIAPIAGTPTRLYDLSESSTYLDELDGIRTITTLEVAAYTDAAYEVIAASDYFLRPIRPRPGWPYTRVILSDRATGTYARFPAGFETVRIVGTFGWPAIPDDLIEVAEVAAVKAWSAREAGQSDIIGTDEMGRPLVSRFFSLRDLNTIRYYSSTLPG